MAYGHGGARENTGDRYGSSPERTAARLDFEEQRARHEKAKADRAEFDLEVERGRHLPRAVVAAASATAIAAFTQSMRSIGPTLERTLALPPETVESIERSIDEALLSLSEQLEQMTRLPGAGRA